MFVMLFFSVHKDSRPAESGKGKERPQNEQRGLNVKGPPKGQKRAFWAKMCLLRPKVGQVGV